MKSNKQQQKLAHLIKEINAIIERAQQLEKAHKTQLSKVHPRFVKSARNLIHYRALRMVDIRTLQKELGNKGLSRLAKSEGHVMASLYANKHILESLIGKTTNKKPHHKLSFKESNRLEKSNAKTLLGYRSKGRRTRIMVTLPSEAADNYQLVENMIANGMNCARINCAHDNTVVWKKMVEYVRKASAKLKRKCKIAMDLGGPKIRTGALVAGPKVKKYRPVKDIRGKVVEACEIWMSPVPPTDSKLAYLPVKWKKPEDLKVGDQLYFKDARKKKRVFTITKTTNNACLVQALKTTYLETGIKIYTDAKRSYAPIEVDEIPPIEQAIILHQGDFLRLHSEATLGENAQLSKKGQIISPAHLSCTLPTIVEQVKKGEPIFFDDGKVEGVIRKVNKEEILIEIVHASANGSKLKADKGINLPSSELNVNGLTAKDKEDLKFVVRHTDVINLSFVNRAQDVRDLFAELRRLKAPEKLGIILKIETQSGFNQLTDILLEAMQVHPVGVMIARGDLAIECGWNNIGRVQEEMLAFCHAAGVPVVWATQVLENLSKQGIPSRAEITDAAMAQRADCVMLNKGPYILQSIHLLDTILKDMAPYQDKNAPLLPMMKKAGIQ